MNYVEYVRRAAVTLTLALRRWHGDSEDTATVVRDTLATLRHVCDRYDLDFAEEDRRAYQLYAEERATMNQEA